MRTTILILSLACVFIAGATERYSSRVLATIGTEVITSFDIDMACAEQIKSLPANLAPTVRAKQIEEIRKYALDNAINRELIYMDFVELKGSIPPNYIQERIDSIVQQQANGNATVFRDMLHRQNITYQEFYQRLLKNIAIEMLTYDRTRRNLFITEQQIAKYFQEHNAEFSQPVRYRIQAILLKGDGKYANKLQATVGEIRYALTQGQSFDELAKKYSEGVNAENGGDLGWQTSVAPGLQKVVEQLKVGEIYNGMLMLGNNAYIIRLAGKEGGATPTMTPEIKEKIRTELENQEAERRFQEYVSTLYMKYPVRRF